MEAALYRRRLQEAEMSHSIDVNNRRRLLQGILAKEGDYLDEAVEKMHEGYAEKLERLRENIKLVKQEKENLRRKIVADGFR